MQLNSNELSTRPLPNQIEVTVFGLGIGESIVVHLGDGKWAIVDSCQRSGDPDPIPIWYLKRLGVNLINDVDVVVATHWHDDHINGLASVIAACANARFCCAAALTKQEFVSTATALHANNRLLAGSGAREIVAIYESIAARPGRPPVRKAMQDRLLHRIEHHWLGEARPTELWSLSPSDRELDIFLAQIASMLPDHKTTKFRVLAQNPNNTAIVLKVESPSISILLGSDLENRDDPHTGWKAVLSSYQRSRSQVQCFKIPHHGSKNAHNDDVWSDLLVENPVAILTPYDRGRKRLPAEEDIRRIRGSTGRAFQAGALTRIGTRGYESAVEKTIREAGVTFDRIIPKLGAVRYREGMGGAPDGTVECFGVAGPLGHSPAR